MTGWHIFGWIIIFFGAILSTIVGPIFIHKGNMTQKEKTDTKIIEEVKKENKPKVNIQDSDLNNSPVIVDSPGTKVSIQEEESQRTISPEVSKIIVDNLKSISPLMIEIRAVAGDQESVSLSKQIKTIFEKAGWNVNWAMQFFTEKINSFIVVASEDPGKEFRKAIAPLFTELGYDPVINRDDNVPAGTVWIQVGANQ